VEEKGMKLMRGGLTLVTLAFLWAAPAGATPVQDREPWVHIRVIEAGTEGERVEINLPLTLVDIALDMAPKDVILNGRLELDSSDFSVDEMRRLWRQLRSAGDAEFVTVEKKDERVRVARKGNRLLVNVTDLPAATEQVKIEVPLPLVDALFAGTGPTLEIRGALAELKRMRGEILSVEDGEDTVRIWIDERPSARS
jgi:autotransporter translocation and assembly factor TamB